MADPQIIPPGKRSPWLTTDLRGFAGKLLVGGGSLYLGNQMVDVFRDHPAETFALAKAWGPAFAVIFLLIYMWSRSQDRQFDLQQKQLDQQERGIAAQEMLAEATHKLANKDDVKEQRNELLIAQAAADSARLVDAFERQQTALDRIEQFHLKLGPWIDNLKLSATEPAKENK
ncbi:hypothetical protein [Terriglobus sp. RCC_193]|uniref:hypothetical protein n=1 Tax=Terriglobus sp. RCC_193 TaxID=3239218 RepID=UPI0035248DC8